MANLVVTYKKMSEVILMEDILLRVLICDINTLTLFWPILGQRKTSLVINNKRERVQLSFWPILFLMA